MENLIEHIVKTALKAFGFIIIGSMILFASAILSNNTDDNAVKICRSRICGVQTALELYLKEFNTYPGELSVLVAEGYLPEENTVDPWGRRLKYRMKNGGYELYSSGPDNIFGTHDDLAVSLD